MDISELYDHSYVPYSGKAAVAVVKSKTGEVFPGVRVENASFPLTIPAIQSALFCCISEGYEPDILFIQENTPHELSPFWEKAYSLNIKYLKPKDNFSFSSVVQQVQSVKLTLHTLLDQAVTNESDFPVSALLKTDKGYISGVNIELKPWNCGLCAERTAIAKAISYGITNFQALYICTDKGEYGSPCGACRQVIVEHLPHQPVCLYQPDGTRNELFSSDLLPYSFQSSTLKS